MKNFIFWNDLTETAQNELIESLKKELIASYRATNDKVEHVYGESLTPAEQGELTALAKCLAYRRFSQGVEFEI